MISADALARHVGPEYARHASQARTTFQRKVDSLLDTAGPLLPPHAFSEAEIREFLLQIASLDSNNFDGVTGVGEREGRVLCPLVRDRHFGFAHGMGRSGDVAALQPKAAGGSLLCSLANRLALGVLRLSGLKHTGKAVVLPLATGAALSLCFATLRWLRIAEAPDSPAQPRYIIWSRIDQKTCLKAVRAGGCEAVVVPLLQEGDGGRDVQQRFTLRTDVDGIAAALERQGPANVVAVCVTTSTFAPRSPDSVAAVGSVCAAAGVPLVVNNAYGLQCSKIAADIDLALMRGHVTAFVQSTDKNCCVPVGGAIIAEGKPVRPARKPCEGAAGQAPAPRSFVDEACATYPGRASNSPIVDFVSTALWLGEGGFRKMWSDRRELRAWFVPELARVVKKHGAHVVDCGKSNSISSVVSLAKVSGKPRPKVEEGGVELGGAAATSAQPLQASKLGSMLFYRRVSGARVVAAGDDDGATKKIDGHTFHNYGSHSDATNFCYLTTAVSVGARREELVVFLARLDAALDSWRSE